MKTRRLLVVTLASAVALALGLSGCSDSTSNPGSASGSGTTYTIGVAVIVAHPSLQLVQQGFEETLKADGINYKLISENAQGDQANAATIASGFAANKSINLVLAISTPIALAMATAVQDRPILFAAVTDPVGAGLVPSWDQAGPNITGTSDLNPTAKPVDLILKAKPSTKTIGVLYSSSEPNSQVQVTAYQTQAEAAGVTLKTQAITSSSDISVGLAALKGVDALLIPTDNTVIASLSTVIGWGQDNQIPIFSADADSVSQGTVAAQGVSYEALGKQTGDMAVKILRDHVDVSTIKPLAVTDAEMVANPDAAKTFGLTLPDSFLQGAKVVTTTSS